MSQPLHESAEQVRVLVIMPDNMTGELLKTGLSRWRKQFSIQTVTGNYEKVIGELAKEKKETAEVALISNDLQDGPEAGFEVLEKLQDTHREVAPIMFLEDSNPNHTIRAFRQGARGIFYRRESLNTLAKCIQTVHSGQIWVANGDVEYLLGGLNHSTPFSVTGSEGSPRLTPREMEIVRLALDGMRNREIAQELGVTEHSVRNYLYRVFEKLGVSSRVELILRVSSNAKPH
jgi:DNA-binding NarL/FixJ family response regulator